MAQAPVMDYSKKKKKKKETSDNDATHRYNCCQAEL